MTKHLLHIYRILFDEFGPQNWWPAETKDEIIIGAILTQNTNWTNVETAIKKLQSKDLLSLNALADADPQTVAICIKSSGYYNQKTERLISISKALWDYYHKSNDLDFRKYLLSLRGIGPETADSILLYAYGIPFFVIDTYTRRIFSRMGLTEQNQSYNSMQEFFMKYLFRDVYLYNEYHALLVNLAKKICKKKPICSACPLRDVCKHGMKVLSE